VCVCVYILYIIQMSSCLLFCATGISKYCPTASSECLQELARINQEIKSVKDEVEKERRRLSRYQTEHEDPGDTPATQPRAHGHAHGHAQPRTHGVNTGGYTPTLRRAPKLSSQAQKYVVDISKPRTDLEYDPLSNFSADLRSYSSSGKDHKAKAAFKRARDPPRDLPRGPALEDDLTEEGDLVIDLPSSPDLKKHRVHNVTEHQPVGVEPEQRSPPVSVTTPTMPLPPQTSSAEVFQSDATSVAPMESEQTPERAGGQPVDVFDGLSKYLEDLRSENQKTARVRAAEPAEERTSSCDGDAKGRPGTFRDHFPDTRPAIAIDAPPQAHAADQMNSAQPERDPHLVPPGVRQLSPRTEPPADALAAQHYWCPADGVPSVLPRGQSHAHGPADPPPPSPSANSAGDRSCPLYTPSTLNVQSSLQSPPPAPPPARAQSSSGGANVITIGSSSEGESDGEKLNYADMDVSDSDPMEECYRIFMEANEAENEALVPEAQAPEAQAPAPGNVSILSNPQHGWVLGESPFSTGPHPSSPGLYR